MLIVGFCHIILVSLFTFLVSKDILDFQSFHKTTPRHFGCFSAAIGCAFAISVFYFAVIGGLNEPRGPLYVAGRPVERSGAWLTFARTFP